MRKKNLVMIIVVFSLFSCGNKKNQPVVQSDTVVITSLDTTSITIPDTITVVEETDIPEPYYRDGSFEDFVYHFATDEKFQKRRAIFPLPYYKEETPLKIEKEEWEHDSLFYNSSYYTLLADTEEELESMEDTTRTSMQVEWVLMEDKSVKRYYFERKEGRWMLEAINLRSFEEEERNSFTDFFIRFATDSVFQATHIRNPLEFVTIDPDDDFSILETTLDPNQWFAFKPELPKERLSNINYGQSNNVNSSQKILQLKGIGNGFLNTLFFRKKNGTWELYKFEDTSN